MDRRGERLLTLPSISRTNSRLREMLFCCCCLFVCFPPSLLSFVAADAYSSSHGNYKGVRRHLGRLNGLQNPTGLQMQMSGASRQKETFPCAHAHHTARRRPWVQTCTFLPSQAAAPGTWLSCPRTLTPEMEACLEWPPHPLFASTSITCTLGLAKVRVWASQEVNCFCFSFQSMDEGHGPSQKQIITAKGQPEAEDNEMRQSAMKKVRSSSLLTLDQVASS